MAMLSNNPPADFGNKEEMRFYTISNTVFEIDAKYAPMKLLGEGAYGVVCSSINRETSENVAIKKIRNVFEDRIDALRTLREMKLLGKIKHENVIEMKDIMLPSTKRSFVDVYLVFELMDTDLGQIIRSPQPLSDEQCQCFIFQLLRGLKYLHSANVIHRDLKPGNLLVNSDCELKIGDFGLARTKSPRGEGMNGYVVTRWYRAPELLVCSDSYDAAIDMWSVGCIFAAILGRKPLFPGTDSAHQLELILNTLGVNHDAADFDFVSYQPIRDYIDSLPDSPGVPFASMFPDANPLAVDLLKKLLVFNPAKRINATEALEHPYMAQLYDPLLDPAAKGPIDLGFDDDLGEDKIREMIWEETLCYHPGLVSRVRHYSVVHLHSVPIEQRADRGFTPFHLVYASEAVVPVEVGVPSTRRMLYDEENAEQRLAELDLISETHEQTTIRLMAYQQRMRQNYDRKKDQSKPGTIPLSGQAVQRPVIPKSGSALVRGPLSISAPGSAGPQSTYGDPWPDFFLREGPGALGRSHAELVGAEHSPL
ncbi:mitogen-activated protein kinase 4-like [Zingiber officinale]|uniref:mitogen-activated protein kinase 4-like n=1 Tax=Zingiber officinale TaxID=94328 RepID=UPI001C4DC90E|nr:mitogen-activated protein kinase 4-like [Zingiber officinale]